MENHLATTRADELQTEMVYVIARQADRLCKPTTLAKATCLSAYTRRHDGLGLHWGYIGIMENKMETII